MDRHKLLAVILAFSCSAQAGMTAEERCAKQGEAAGRAGELRDEGRDKEAAIQTLRAEYPEADSQLTEQNILGLTNVAYMTKMSPAKLRSYATDQCKQNILR